MNALDFFEIKRYNKSGKGVGLMDFLSSSEITVTKIVLAICVEKGAPCHRNRPSHGLALRTGGRAEYVFEDGARFLVEAGDLIYLPKGSSYTVRHYEIGKTYAINFEIDAKGDFDPFVMNLKGAFVASEAFVAAERAWMGSLGGRDAEIRARLYDILAYLQREREAGLQKDARRGLLQKAERYIDEHFRNPELRVGDIAAVCGMSEVYLRKIFRGELGETPVERIRMRRIECAKALIASGFYSMKEVAMLSGYADYSYFCREFKKDAGCAPSEYR